MCSLPTLNSDCQQSTKEINLKPTPGTAPASQLSGEASYIFVSHFNGFLTLTNLKKALDNYIIDTILYYFLYFTIYDLVKDMQIGM